MKILIVGSGGREHALAWKIAQSPRLTRAILRPGERRDRSCRREHPDRRFGHRGAWPISPSASGST